MNTCPEPLYACMASIVSDLSTVLKMVNKPMLHKKQLDTWEYKCLGLYQVHIIIHSSNIIIYQV